MRKKLNKTALTLFIFLFQTSMLTCISALAFEKTFKRYLSGHDIQRTVEHAFPTGNNENHYDCLVKTAELNATGFALPLTGEVTSKKPGSFFFNYYTNCLKYRIASSFDQLQSRYLPPSVFASTNANGNYFYYNAWTTLDPKIRSSLITHWVHLVLGPGVLNDHEETTLVHEYEAKKEFQYLNIRDVATNILYSLALRDEFLNY